MATKLDEDGLCDCDFDPYPDERDEESWHYLRACEGGPYVCGPERKP